MSSTNKYDFLVLLGPTAVGKTAVAIALAKRMNAVIINADSRQFYRELNIGTAKPTLAEQKQASFALIDCASVITPWSVGDFVAAADASIAQAMAKGCVPLLVGGTGMYVQSLLFGLSQIPPITSEIKASLKHDLANRGLSALYAELVQSDPVTADRINPSDTQRVLRALEVKRQTGRGLNEFWQESKTIARYKPLIVGLDLPRPVLYDRIDQRVEVMLTQGLKAEVFALWQSFPENVVLANTIGYAEWAKHGFDNEALVADKIRQNTRNYAKRQLTWFRNKLQVQWVSAGEGAVGKIGAMKGLVR